MPNAFIRKLNDKDGNVIFPASRAAGIYFDDDSVLQDYVASNGVMNKALGDKNGKDLTSYVTGLSVNGRTVTYTKGDGTSGTIQTQDTDTKYSVFKGATSSAAGGTGLVPAPAKGDQAKFLKADGTWGTPENTTYKEATTSTAGLMSSADKTKLDGIATGANKYTHPSYTNRASGLYKITVDATGHVSAATAVTKSDITSLGIPGQDTNTTYTPATDDADGLMSAEDKSKLDGIASGANKTTVDTALSTSSTNPVRNSVVTNALNKKASTSHSHSAATTSTAGFMSASDKTLLNSLSNSVIVDTSWGSSVSDIP